MTAEFPLAVHALVYLLHTGRITPSQELADNICTNPARVRKVMTKLHRAGLAESVRGQGSGYRCGGETAAVTLGTVLRSLEEEPLSMSWRSGDMDRECLISSGMGAIMDGIYGQLNRQCMETLESMTIGDLTHQIFDRKKETT
ncbi:Rrf2 family transcriptional regulator [Oscillibacter sp.]|uniref:RrF2 family transcriptional regulator n=1 Tax=Oscillibacter sp. TaxID=1945593 RepID=UPI002623D403|nr:Rrf2 family transcriptional regulator [Oscillibacter sp.]MDD3347990.1 Rrf2 family transcriptional regulator [Oscillibacter sp.]